MHENTANLTYKLHMTNLVAFYERVMAFVDKRRATNTIYLDSSSFLVSKLERNSNSEDKVDKGSMFKWRQVMLLMG